MTTEHPVVVITGAGSGIGRASAIRFAQEGARVVVVDRADGDGRMTADLLKSRGQEALFVHADVAVEKECHHFARAAVDAYGRIDALVASAGVRVFGTILDMTDEDWDRILSVNLKGVSFSCKAVLPQMIKQQSGAIVLIGSTTALTGRTNMPLLRCYKVRGLESHPKPGCHPRKGRHPCQRRMPLVDADSSSTSKRRKRMEFLLSN